MSDIIYTCVSVCVCTYSLILFIITFSFSYLPSRFFQLLHFRNNCSQNTISSFLSRLSFEIELSSLVFHHTTFLFKLLRAQKEMEKKNPSNDLQKRKMSMSPPPRPTYNHILPLPFLCWFPLDNHDTYYIYIYIYKFIYIPIIKEEWKTENKNI